MSTLYSINSKIFNINGQILMMPDHRVPFVVSIWITNGNGFNSFTLPLTNHTTDIYVKTSDGQRFTITNYLDPKRIISFPSAGIYTIEMRGECGWSFNNTGDCQKLIEIRNWGNLKFNNLVSGFYGCINLTTLPLTGSINAPLITSLQYLFYNCNKNKNIGSSDIFKRCLNVTNFQSTFYRNQLTSLPADLFRYNINVTNFYGTFELNPLTSIPADLFRYNINVTSFYGTFWNDQLTTIPADLFRYNTLVTNFGGTFHLNKLVSIPADLFRYNTLVTSFYGTFWNDQLTTIPADLFRYNTVVTNFQETFSTNKLTSIPADLFRYNTLVTNYSNTFQNALASGCTMPSVMFDLSKINIVTSWQNMFNQNSTTNSPLGSVQDIWNYASAGSVKTDCFNNCTQLTNYTSIPVEWI